MHEFLAVDLIQYIFEHTSESSVCARFDVRFRQLKPASSGPSSLLSSRHVDISRGGARLRNGIAFLA